MQPEEGIDNMFMGEFSHALDSKGRLIIPVKLREGLGERFIITRGLDVCLFAYPLPEWEVMEQKLKALPLTRADARAFMRLFFSGAVEVERDKQSRILIPQNLRGYAHLEREVTVLGVSSRVEIWADTVWKNYSEKQNSSFEQIAEQLVDFDL